VSANTLAPAVASPCGCGCGCTDLACDCCDPVGLERTRFFPRMLVGPDELTQDQTWIRDRLRRHNRLLHGWGVVCGCNVTQATDANGQLVPWMACVDVGDVLGPCGDDIVVECPVTFDVRTGLGGDLGPCTPPADPWCVDVTVPRRPTQTYYLAIRYDEVLTRPVRTLAGCGCGCDDAECEYSRIRESFAVGVLDALPDSYVTQKVGVGASGSMTNNPWGFGAATGAANLAGALLCSPLLRERVRPCPPCPTDPWVILADFQVDDQGTLAIDPIAHRRYVVAFGSYFFMCGAVEANQTPAGTPLTAGMKKLLAAHLDAKAVPMVENAGQAEAALSLQATAMRGVGPASKLGQFLGGRTIGDVAGMERGAFLQEAEAAKVDVQKAGKMWDAVNTMMTGLAGSAPP
jgi:hypothetical protein